MIALPLNGKGKQEFTAAWMKPQKKKKKKVGRMLRDDQAKILSFPEGIWN